MPQMLTALMGMKRPMEMRLTLFFFLSVFLKDFIYFQRRGGREGGREGEKHLLVASHMPPTGDLAHNPGMCPEPVTLRFTGQQPTEPHQPGLKGGLLSDQISNHWHSRLLDLIFSSTSIFSSDWAKWPAKPNALSKFQTNCPPVAREQVVLEDHLCIFFSHYLWTALESL